jgi:alkylhydroperoxidase/carboxymuconolactone decarboxylase family protein YurZ
MKTETPTKTPVTPQTTGPWDAALDTLREWDPQWAETCVKMSMNPWSTGVLSRKLVDLIGVGLNAACTNLNPDGTRRHIHNALQAGATIEEIMEVLKLCVVQGVQACNLACQFSSRNWLIVRTTEICVPSRSRLKVLP